MGGRLQRRDLPPPEGAEDAPRQRRGPGRGRRREGALPDKGLRGRAQREVVLAARAARGPPEDGEARAPQAPRVGGLWFNTVISMQ